MATVRNSSLLKNPSGTSGAIGHSPGLASLPEGGGALLAGYPGHLVAAGSAIVGNNILARALDLRVAQWLAMSTKLPNAVNEHAQLGRAKNDSDARDLAAYTGAAALLRARVLHPRIQFGNCLRTYWKGWRCVIGAFSANIAKHRVANYFSKLRP